MEALGALRNEESGAQTPVRRRDVLRAGAILAGLGLATSACGSSPAAGRPSTAIRPKIDGDITFFTYSEYIAPELVTEFEQKHGVKVTQAFFDSERDGLAKIVAGQPYDLVMMANTFIPGMVQAGLLRQIDTDAFTNWDQVLKFFQDPFYDRGSRHCVPYDFGPAGVTWRTDKHLQITGSWSDLWTNDTKASGHVYLTDAPEAAMGVALAHLGFPPYSGNPKQVAQAGDALHELLPHLGAFTSDDVTNLVNGQSWLEFAWSGDLYHALVATKKPLPVNFGLCKETQFYNSDNLLIPKTSKSPGTAAMFMDWMLAPANVQRNVTYIGYPVPTRTGMAAYKTLTAKYPFLAAATDQLNDPAGWAEPLVGKKLALYTDTLTKVQAAA
jgi:spermidine/putrescine-binding protein